MLNDGAPFPKSAIAKLRKVVVFFAQKSFQINLPPAHQLIDWRKPYVNKHRIEPVEHRLQIVDVFARKPGRIKFNFVGRNDFSHSIFVHNESRRLKIIETRLIDNTISGRCVSKDYTTRKQKMRKLRSQNAARLIFLSTAG